MTILCAAQRLAAGGSMRRNHARANRRRRVRRRKRNEAWLLRRRAERLRKEFDEFCKAAYGARLNSLMYTKLVLR